MVLNGVIVNDLYTGDVKNAFVPPSTESSSTEKKPSNSFLMTADFFPWVLFPCAKKNLYNEVLILLVLVIVATSI